MILPKSRELLIISYAKCNEIFAQTTNTVSPVCMAVKSHLRNQRPVVIAASTNDALSGAAKNIGTLRNYKNFYFVPLLQDDCLGKPFSLVADFKKIPQTILEALDGRQIQPVYEIKP